MCGIVGATAQRPSTPILLEGLKCLEYRGYDSAGIATLNADEPVIDCAKVKGKVKGLEALLQQTTPSTSPIGIAHTRWATHGEPCEKNAHPHASSAAISLVHNGIIENHNPRRAQLQQSGYHFESQTDTEVIVHLLHQCYQQSNDMVEAIECACQQLEGAYALGILHIDYPDTLFAVKKGSPLVIGVGIGEHFIASDPLALQPVTHRFIHLEDDDIAVLTPNHCQITHQQQVVQRDILENEIESNRIDKGHFRHFMLKEIYEQPQAISDTITTHINNSSLNASIFGPQSAELFQQVQRVHIIACGTSYNAGLTAKDWIEHYAHLPCQVDIASEQRYRKTLVEPNTLLIALSQSGETADTLAALRQAKSSGYLSTLAICNVAHSTLARESELTFITRAGHEIGVAATKTFTAQLSALMILSLSLAQYRHTHTLSEALTQLQHTPSLMNDLLQLDTRIQHIAKQFAQATNALFLARGQLQAIATEGALKLKEISYIHAESYFAGELKHGPLALVDEHMPIIVLAPTGPLYEKTAANIQEVKARGGQLIIITDDPTRWETYGLTTIAMPTIPLFNQPIAYAIPMQLLAYHVAVLKGTDVDQPRNLAKSVTVE